MAGDNRMGALLGPHEGNEIALDALGQFAVEGSYVVQGTQRDRQIAENLVLHWPISATKAQELIADVKSIVPGWIDDWDLRRQARGWLAGPGGEKLRSSMRARLRSDVRARRFVQVVFAYRGLGAPVDELTEGLWVELQAGYDAARGEVPPRISIEDVVTKLGIYSRLPITYGHGTKPLLCPALSNDWLPYPKTSDRAAIALEQLESEKDWEQLRWWMRCLWSRAARGTSQDKRWSATSLTLPP